MILGEVKNIQNMQQPIINYLHLIMYIQRVSVIHISLKERKKKEEEKDLANWHINRHKTYQWHSLCQFNKMLVFTLKFLPVIQRH